MGHYYYAKNGELIGTGEDVIAKLEVEIAELKNAISVYKEKADARFDEIIRLQRHSRMQDLAIAGLKEQLEGIPEITPYSDTAESEIKVVK